MTFFLAEAEQIQETEADGAQNSPEGGLRPPARQRSYRYNSRRWYSWRWQLADSSHVPPSQLLQDSSSTPRRHCLGAGSSQAGSRPSLV